MYLCTTMYKNLIFDFGGVIIDIDHDEAVRRFTALGVADAARLLDPYTQGGPFGKLEEGSINDEDFRQEMCQLTGREVTWEECQYAWMGYMSTLPNERLQLLEALRNKDYRLILLSNTNPYIAEWAESPRFDGRTSGLSSYFDAVYKSFEVGIMKPDERIFRLLIEREGINPAESLFVDDGPRNVAAAERLGFHTLCPTPGENWIPKLNEKLI